MKYGRILAAARHYDARRVWLEAKETELLRYGTSAARKANDEAIGRNWAEFTSKEIGRASCREKVSDYV